MHINQAKPTALKTSIKLKKSVLFVCYALLVISSPLSAATLNTNLPITIDLPIQPLAESLKQYSKKSGISIAVDSSLVQGKLAPAIKGNYDNAEALAQLLSGSGLEANMEGATAVIKRARLNTAKTDTMQLKPVEVRAKRFYQIGPLPGLGLTKEEIPGNVQSISAKEIKESHALSISDLMNSKLQSVNVNDYQSNPFQMDVTYRGFTASPQLGTAQGLSVFLDGIRVNEPFGDVVNWDMLPLNALAGLDVFPGSNPIFGLGTLGGAISMRTKSGFDANEGTVEALGGSFKRNQFQGSIGGNNGTIAGFAAFNVFKEDGWRDNSPSKVNQVFTKLEWRNESLQLGLSGLYAGNELTGNGLLPTEIAQQDRSQVFTSPDVTKNKLLQFQFTGLWDVSDTFNITGQVYKRKSKRNSSTGDVNQNFAGSATRRPNPGEQVSAGFADADNDGLPDPTSIFVNNVAATQDGFALDVNGQPSQISGGIQPILDENGLPVSDQDGNPLFEEIFISNPVFDGNNLAIGTDANTPLFANQGTQDVFDANGNFIGTAPLWDSNPNAIYNPPEDWRRRALILLQNRDNGSNRYVLLQNRLFPANSGEFFNPQVQLFSGSYIDSGGFSTQLNYDQIVGLGVDPVTGQQLLVRFENIEGSGGIGQPLGLILKDPLTDDIIDRDGANCGQFPGIGTCAGYVEGTPTALITETDIGQVTDGMSMQLNWNLEKHKFMVGASIDSSDATYKSGQYLGLLDENRNAYLDPANVGYEFAAATNKIGLNDFGGNSITKSLYFSETWTPSKPWAFTAAGRYNQTYVKNELAINNILGLRGPTSFKNFLQEFVLCQDLDQDGVVTPDECPSTEILPFTLDRANGLGAIGKGETEKFSYYSFNPSFGATWQPHETLNLYANWNQGARTPSVIELGCAFDDTPVFEFNPTTGQLENRGPRSLVERRFCSLPSVLSGDPYLKQVRSETVEFGGRGYLTPDIQWNATVYQTDLQDDIYFVSYTPERSFFQNIGNTRRRGLEMGLQGKIGKAGFRLNYSLTDATFQDQFKIASPHNSSAGNVLQGDGVFATQRGYQQIAVNPGNRIPGVPLHNLNATFSYDLTPSWTAGLTAVLHSESFVRGNENNKHRAGAANIRYRCGATNSTTTIDGIEYGNSNCDASRQLPSFRFPGKVPGYAVFNFNTSYKINKNLTAALLINNVFNREYYSAGRLGINPFSPSVNGAIGPGGFNYNSSEHLSSTFLAPGAPRSAFISLTYDFDLGR